MFERFTPKARQVVVAAQEEARGLQHDYIGTEHLLLGLLSVPEGVGASALRELAISSGMVRADVESMVGRGQTTESSGHIAFTPRAKKVLELALREALRLSHNYIGTEHILLALVREGDGVAARIIADHVDDMRSVRAAVLAMISSKMEDEPAAGRRQKTTTAAEEVVTTAEALAGGAPIGSHHLLEALARAEGSMAARALQALGVDVDELAAKIDELDPEGTTDATPAESAARKMELRLDGDEVHLIFRDADVVELTKKVTEAVGGPVRGTGPVAGAFVPLWTATNELLRKFLEFVTEPEDEPKEGLSKAAQAVRGMIRSRLRRGRPPAPEVG